MYIFSQVSFYTGSWVLCVSDDFIFVYAIHFKIDFWKLWYTVKLVNVNFVRDNKKWMMDRLANISIICSKLTITIIYFQMFNHDRKHFNSFETNNYNNSFSDVQPSEPGCSKQPPRLPSTTDDRCGCVGGCSFFGGNRNGPRFFQFSRQDVLEGLNTAQFRINGPGEDIGYGQSLLYPRELVMNVAAYTNLVTSHFELSGAPTEHSTSAAKHKYSLSAGYTRGCGGESPLPSAEIDGKSSARLLHRHHPSFNRTVSQPQGESSSFRHHPQFRSLGRPGGLRVPPAREISPGRSEQS